MFSYGAFVRDRIVVFMIRTRLHDLILLPGQLPSHKTPEQQESHLPVIKPRSLFLGSLLASTKA